MTLVGTENTSFQSRLASNCEGLPDMLTRTFDSAIRGFHYYRKYWSPKIEENLVCSHERNNIFNIFAINICKEDGEVVVHLSREPNKLSRIVVFKNFLR